MNSDILSNLKDEKKKSKKKKPRSKNKSSKFKLKSGTCSPETL